MMSINQILPVFDQTGSSSQEDEKYKDEKCAVRFFRIGAYDVKVLVNDSNECVGILEIKINKSVEADQSRFQRMSKINDDDIYPEDDLE